MLKKLPLCLSFLLVAQAQADGLLALENFVRIAQSGRADFTQVVTSPPKDGQQPRSKTSSGTFVFERPGKFSFVYEKPFAQSIVADGYTLWMYDVDLNQVTARNQAGALGSTPAALIAAAPNLAALKKDFDLRDVPGQMQDGLEWVEALPKTRDGQLQSVKVGLRGDALAVLEIEDSFGQRSRLTFSSFKLNPALAADAFKFTPPAGADVLRQ